MSLRKNNFLLVGTGSYANRGCEAIVRGTIEILSRRFKDAHFVLVPFGNNKEDNEKVERDPRIDHRMPRHHTIIRYSMAWWLYRIFLRAFPQLEERHLFGVHMNSMKNAVCALEIGGDNYSLDYGIPRAFLQLDKYLLSTGKSVILWGASIGPFTDHPEVEKMIRDHLSNITLICARESETVSYLDSIGINKNVRLVADPAFLMSPVEPALSEEMMLFIGNNPIGLNLSPLAGRYKKRNRAGQWSDEAAECIRCLVNANIAPVLLIPHVMQENNNDYDFLFETVERHIGWTNNIKILPPTLSAAEYKWVISKMRAFIGARTHSTIASLSTGVPTISIGYSLKARGLNKDVFGSLKWMVSVEDISPVILLSKLKELLSEERSVSSLLEKKRSELESRALSAADYIEEVVYEN